MCNQIDENQERLEAFARIVGEGFVARDGSELSDEAREFVDGPLSLNRLLDGYTEEFDGMVAVVKDGTVLLTDSDQFKAGVSIDMFFGEGSGPILSEYASSGKMVQLVYSDENLFEPAEEDRIYSLQVAYLRVGQVDDYLVLMIQPASMVFADRAGVMVWLTLSALVLLLVVFAASSRTTRTPMRRSSVPARCASRTPAAPNRLRSRLRSPTRVSRSTRRRGPMPSRPRASRTLESADWASSWPRRASTRCATSARMARTW